MTETPIGTNPFHADGVWLKCQLHSHSIESDGDLTPHALAEQYATVGYDVLSITDHWLRTLLPEREDGMLLIPGAELGFDLEGVAREGLSPAANTGEFLVWGLKEDPPADPGGNPANWEVNEDEHWTQRTFPSLSDAGAWATAQGAVVYVAHPHWTGLDPSVIVEAENVAGLELYNGTADIENDRGDSTWAWDVVLDAGKRCFAIGTDDSHMPLFDINRGWTMVKAAERSESAVLDALREGAAYVSNGPELRTVTRQGDVVEVECSPCERLVLHMDTDWGYGIVVHAGDRNRRVGEIIETDGRGLITRARLVNNNPTVRFMRLVAIDERGRRAWTNPL